MKAPHQAPSVLIVEDERIVAKDIQQTLKELGYDAFAIASSAEEAIARASERCPDIVLMDIRIKGRCDGIETAEILKTKFAVPVVYLTAHADEGTIARAKKTEPHGYLLKPVKSAELRGVIEVSLYKHEMEKRLRERERWFSTTLRSIADAVITVDLAGNVTFMNPEAEALTGMKAAEVLGRSASDVLRLLDEQAKALGDTPLERVLREHQRVSLLEAGLRNAATGAVRSISDSAAPVLDEERMLGAVMVFRDVTEQKKMQKQLELADRLASLGTMAAGVVHEVNNPLAVVVTNAAFIGEEMKQHRTALADAGFRLAPEAEGRLNEITQAIGDLQSAGSRIARIVADLRGFSRPATATSGRADVVAAIDWAVRATAHELRHRAQLVTKLNHVPMVEADEGRLGQVFVNLLINAAQAISPGNADRNEVCVQTAVDESGRVRVEVRDTGGGIPEDIQKRIFEPFFTTKAVGSGTGLGLSICHGIVTSLGGEIEVESEVGKGTIFRILLPPGRKQQTEAPTPAAVAPRALQGRILVVDDEDMVLRAIARILRGHDVVCTASAREALALLERGAQFDLLFSDLTMPTMTGIEFYEELLRRSPDVARRVVFLSGGAITSKVEDFLQSVPNVRIEKPFEVSNLLETVQHLLGQAAAHLRK
jgi:PAS domain S-box-containing protein